MFQPKKGPKPDPELSNDTSTTIKTKDPKLALLDAMSNSGDDENLFIKNPDGTLSVNRDDLDERYPDNSEEEARLNNSYKKMILESREGGNKPEITKENVVKGLKFIAEHPGMEQVELIKNIINLGCNYIHDDIVEGYKNLPNKPSSLFEGIKEGNLLVGAEIISHIISSKSDRELDLIDNIFKRDDEYSIYHIIRLLSEDESYTMDYVKNLIQNNNQENPA